MSRGAIDALGRHGLLLAADVRLPSVTTIVAGEPVRGSWWAHPKGRAIFAAIRALSHHPDALEVPLVARKVTFVHRALWPALLAVAQSGELWQRRQLSPSARRLLQNVRSKGVVEASGDPAREIAQRLLARTDETHTERGAHAKIVESWDRWADRTGTTPMADAAVARVVLEDALRQLGAVRIEKLLPWG